MEGKSILIIGAGKIGRSFIGQLFGSSGYEVIFADVDTGLVNELNRRRGYPVIIKDEQIQRLWIPHVRAVSALDHKRVVTEISNASVMAVSVGKNALEKVLPLIAEGLKARCKGNPNRPLDIIIAENMRSASGFMRQKLAALLPRDYSLDRLVGLVETSIGKMVPIMTEADLKEDPLQVFAEAYNDLVLDKHGFKGAVPEVAGLCPKENIKAWVDRKAFIHNLGHATAAYTGNFFFPDAIYIYEVLTDEKVYSLVRQTMLQSADVLLRIYPRDFTFTGLNIEDISRFQNKALKDTVFRVGQDLPRKLSINDRFAGIIRLARQQSLPYHRILEAMTCGFFFKAVNEKGEAAAADKKFIREVMQGIEAALVQYCGFHPENVGALWVGHPRFVPCTPLGVMALIHSTGTEIKGKRAVVVGRSNIVGKPVASLLLAEHATVTLCHSRTADLAGECRSADILVAAVATDMHSSCSLTAYVSSISLLVGEASLAPLFGMISTRPSEESLLSASLTGVLLTPI